MTLDCIDIVISDTCARCVEMMRRKIFCKIFSALCSLRRGMIVGEKSLGFYHCSLKWEILAKC